MKFQVESQSSVISGSRHKVSVNSPPASLQDWLDEELERRGIDAVIYTRYILSILLQDSYDVDLCKHNTIDEDICCYYFCNDRKLKNHPTCIKGGSAKKNSEKFICNQHQSVDHEQRKKSAAVECLMSVSDEKYGIEELVEDLCAKLKEFQLENDDDNKNTKFQPPLDDVSEVISSVEEQAKKYYAAFPALSATSTDPILKLSISTANNSDMVIEKSAWMPGHQLLFDCQILPSPDGKSNAYKSTLPGDSDEHGNNPMTISNSTESKLPSFIVPKVKTTAKQHFCSDFVKDTPPFQVSRTTDDVFAVSSSELKTDDSTYKNDAQKYEGVMNEDAEICDGTLAKIQKTEDDDEVLAKFINKFNGDNIASIWDKMLQPSYIDSMLFRLPKLRAAESQQNYLSVWSAGDDCSDSFIASSKFDNNWFDGNWYPSHYTQNSFSLLGYCQDLDTSRRISLTLSESDSDDLSALSHIFHETSENIGHCFEFKSAQDVKKNFGFGKSYKLDPMLPTSVDDLSLLMYDSADKQEDCLLTSARTHFRPIRNESIEEDAEVKENNPINDEISPVAVSLEAHSPESVDEEKEGQFNPDTESESRDSWSPDMKDCFPMSPAWPSSYPISITSNSPTDICHLSGTSQLSLVSPTNHDNGESDSDDIYECQTVGNPLWASESESLTSRNCETPLTIDVGPWKYETPSWAKSFLSSSEIIGQEYSKNISECHSWKYDSPVWPNSLSPHVKAKKLLDLKPENLQKSLKQETWGENCELWPLSKCSTKEFQSDEFVEALRVEIKEETKQLFDDIQDMVSKEKECDIGHDVDDETLCEWMKNVNLNEMPPNTEPLPQLETNMLDDVLGEASVPQLSPDDIIYSSELEAEWIKDSRNFNVQTPRLKDKYTFKSHRRPCSFFLEGNCRRSDCKFSHDLSTITCRFWEDGCCFKGITCPFLHGYPLSSGEDSEPDTTNDSCVIDLNHDNDFPNLPSSKDVSNEDTPDETLKSKKTNLRQKKKRRKRGATESHLLKNK